MHVPSCSRRQLADSKLLASDLLVDSAGLHGASCPRLQRSVVLLLGGGACCCVRCPGPRMTHTRRGVPRRLCCDGGVGLVAGVGVSRCTAWPQLSQIWCGAASSLDWQLQGAKQCSEAGCVEANKLCIHQKAVSPFL
jgi:hypothetical protein